MSSPGVTARDEVLAGLAALGPGADAVSLLGRVRDLAGFIDRAQGHLARLAAVVDAIDGASEAGYSSVAAFLRHGCGRSAARAGELVATGRALRSLEATEKALMAGDISFDAAHVICRTAAQVADPGMAQIAEEQMLAFARVPAPDGAAPDADAQPDADAPADANGGPDGQDGAQPDGPEPGPDGGYPGPGEAAKQPANAGSGAWWASPALDPGQLRRFGEELLYRADPDGVEERERKRFERRHLSFGLTLDGSGTITGACGDTLSAEIIKTAVHAFSPPLGTEDTRTAAQRRMDGLTAACAAALNSGAAGTRHGAAPHLSILVDENTLAGAPGTPGTSGLGATGTGCSCPSGPPATSAPSSASSPGDPSAPTGVPSLLGPPPARTGYGAMLTARQVLALACRADLSVIRWRDGIPLDVGRRYRTETPAIRRALEARDQGCRGPGCGIPAAWSTAHHLTPWKDGGTTSLKDTALFCFVHHYYYIHLLG